MSSDAHDRRFFVRLLEIIQTGNLAEALDQLFSLEYEAEQLKILRQMAEDLDVAFDLDKTRDLAEALGHAYVMTLDITYPLVRDLALPNIQDRIHVLIHARNLAREFSDSLADTPDLTPTFYCAMFVVRALERMLGVA